MSMTTNTVCNTWNFVLALSVALLGSTSLSNVCDAQDFEAIEKRLAKAVKRQEISLHHASAMMEALHHAVAEEQHHDPDRMHHERMEQERMEQERRRDRERELEAVRRKLHAMIKAGELTAEQAEEKVQAMHREWDREAKAEQQERAEREAMERREHELNEAKAELGELVEQGKISREDAEEKLNHVRRELFGQPRGIDARIGEMKREIASILEAIERGDVPRKDGFREVENLKRGIERLIHEDKERVNREREEREREEQEREREADRKRR